MREATESAGRFQRKRRGATLSLRKLQRGFEQPVDNQLGQDIGHAHQEPQRTSRRPSLQDIRQLLPEREDLVRIPQYELSGLGKDQVAPNPFEQLVADRFLQLPQLTADGRLSHVELLAGPRNAAFASDGPEVQEVVVVEPIHADNYI